MASFTQRVRAAWNAGKTAFSQNLVQWSTPPTRGTAELLDAYNTSPWLRLSVGKHANFVASTAWKMYALYPNRQARQNQKGAVRYGALQAHSYQTRWKTLNRLRIEDRVRELDGHPLIEMLARGNPLQSGRTAMLLTDIYMSIKGEAFWLVERNSYGVPYCFYPLPPHWVLDTPHAGSPFFRVNFMTSGLTKEVPEYDMVWFRDPDPVKPYGRGRGAGESLGDEIDADEFAAGHIKAWFYNRAIPPIIVTIEGTGADELKRVKTEWERDHRGIFNAFRNHFTNRPTTVKELGQSFQDQQMVPLREAIRKGIVRASGISPELVGDIENSNRATADAAEYITMRWTIVPRLDFYRTELQVQLVPEFDEKLLLDFDSPIPGDKEFELAVAKAMPWVVDVDEVRTLIGKEPIGGEDGKVRFRPVNMVPYVLGEKVNDPNTSGGDGGEGGHDPDPKPKVPTKTKPTNSAPIVRTFGVDDVEEVLSAIHADGLFDAIGHQLPDAKRFAAENAEMLRFTLIQAANRDETIAQVVKRVTDIFRDIKDRRAAAFAKAEVERGGGDEKKLSGALKRALQKQENDLVRALNALSEEGVR